jgi:hypothetical protein
MPRWRITVQPSAQSTATAAFSRVFLDVHYPTDDMAAGLLVGIFRIIVAELGRGITVPARH